MDTKFKPIPVADILQNREEATILVKSPWDTRRKSLKQLPIVSYCYQIIVLPAHFLVPSPLSPQINVELNMYTNCNIEQGGGGMDSIFIWDMKYAH